MEVYLPIANLAVSAPLIVLLGGAVGLLSGMFGVGGGFLVTPLLIFYGIPTTVAAASAASQVTGTSVTGALAHYRRGGVDLPMAGVMIGGGIVGSLIGAWLFRLLETWGQIDVAIALLYVILLATVGIIMGSEALDSILSRRSGRVVRAPRRRHHPIIAMLPWKQRFRASGLYMSPIAPFALGMLTGVLSLLLGVGGGFIMIPAMIYLLGMATRVVIGTSLVQIVFVTAAATLIHALTTYAVDIVLATLLLLGSCVGAQIGARFASRMPPDLLRLALAVLVLVVALRLALSLGWRPDELYGVEIL